LFRHSSESQPSKKDTLRISLCHGDTEETATAFDPRALKERSEVMEEKENSSTSGNNVKGTEVWHAIPKDSLRVTSPAQLVPLPHSGDAGTVAIPDSTTTSPVPREAVAKDSLMHVLANAPLVPVAYDGSSSSNVLNVKSGGQSSSRSGKNSESSRGDLSVEVSGSAEMGAILSDEKAAHRKANM
uniref:KIAA1522 n=1 Tax=Toxocara canis TaxID=6265 RepID=A0A183U1F0_TOXCA